MLHPAEHFFLGFGPALDIDLSGSEKATIIAGRLTLGGWIRENDANGPFLSLGAPQVN